MVRNRTEEEKARVVARNFVDDVVGDTEVVLIGGVPAFFSPTLESYFQSADGYGTDSQRVMREELEKPSEEFEGRTRAYEIVKGLERNGRGFYSLASHVSLVHRELERVEGQGKIEIYAGNARRMPPLQNVDLNYLRKFGWVSAELRLNDVGKIRDRKGLSENQ